MNTIHGYCMDYTKLSFDFIHNNKDLVKEVVKEIEKPNPKFIISRPLSQKIFTKLYILIKTFIV